MPSFHLYKRINTEDFLLHSSTSLTVAPPKHAFFLSLPLFVDKKHHLCLATPIDLTKVSLSESWNVIRLGPPARVPFFSTTYICKNGLFIFFGPLLVTFPWINLIIYESVCFSLHPPNLKRLPIQ